MSASEKKEAFNPVPEVQPLIGRTLFNETHEAFRETARRFFEREVAPNHSRYEEQGHVDRDLWNKAGEAGLLLTAIPEEYGGLGGDRIVSAVIMEEQARVGASAVGFSLHSDIVAPYIFNFGTEEQKQNYLPRMASGELVGAIAMTEPGTGSDLQGIKTRAEDKGDHWLLNGSKIFITNGYLCDIVIVAAKTGNSGQGSADTSLFIVEAGLDGFTKGTPLKKIGMKGQDTCELFFSDVKLPKDAILGAPGTGFGMLMKELAWERLLIAILAQGAAEFAFEHTLDYAKNRQAFGRPIASFQVQRHKLAQLASEVSLGRVYTDECLRAEVEGRLSPAGAASAKCWVSEMCSRVIDQCVQIHGGYGFMWEYPVARAFVDNRVHQIYGGTNDIMRELIARSL
ncbi:acyl-CoA dehydrogenase family protein [Parvularcula lutaonensis]|uniref:Acyl-CoA dehydrogenase family protein n=1 Tax=Parvularcula lutaonensis TaxID=491923 RepID=A0ABV7M709_9PROT|nr:acyl-CoA dehydrogenase family protein [Parvularcula lutaonensis]GGY56868.1 acyl-CoA dehydrogenase [Parvularcula lutaonensis]